jgi:hypothetical protein
MLCGDGVVAHTNSEGKWLICGCGQGCEEAITTTVVVFDPYQSHIASRLEDAGKNRQFTDTRAVKWQLLQDMIEKTLDFAPH